VHAVDGALVHSGQTMKFYLSYMNQGFVKNHHIYDEALVHDQCFKKKSV